MKEEVLHNLISETEDRIKDYENHVEQISFPNMLYWEGKLSEAILTLNKLNEQYEPF